MKAIPTAVLPKNAADAAELLSALQGGITRKEEPKYNHEAAFGTYIQIVALINDYLTDGDKGKVMGETVLPLLMQYLQPSVNTSQWTIPAGASALLAEAMGLSGMAPTLGDHWPLFTQQLVDAIKTSAPEQSKDYEKSQTAVTQHATRFAKLQEQARKVDALGPLQPVFNQSASLVVAEALGVLRNRNGKPYGAAGAIAVLLSHKSAIVAGSQTERDLEGFVREDLQALILSPSSNHLVDILYAMSDRAFFKDAWSNTLKAVLKELDTPTKNKVLEALLTSPRIPPGFDLASADPELQRFVTNSVHEAVEGAGEWDTFNRILQSRARIVAADTSEDILTYLTQSLSISQRAPYSLQGLRQIVRANPTLLRDFTATARGSELLQSLLRASESPSDEVAQGASAVSASIQALLSSNADTSHSVYSLIHEGLREATPNSVSVETLVDLAKQSIKSGDGWEALQKLLPSVQDWDAALSPILARPPKFSLAITNPLGGALYLVEQTSSVDGNVPRDADGYSAAYRITQYVTKLLKTPDLIDCIPTELRDDYVRNVALTIQLADDNLGLAGANGLWADYNSDSESDAMSFMSDAQPFVTNELQRLSSTWVKGEEGASLLSWAAELLSQIAADTTARAYYHARAHSVLIADAIESHGWKTSQAQRLQDLLKATRKSKAAFPLVACLTAFKEPFAASKSCERMCNEIIADLTGVKLETQPKECLKQLILLNNLLGQEGITDSIAKQRLVFFVKHVVPWLETADLSIKAEICRALTVLIPIMGDMYGEHWNDTLSALAAAWGATQELKEDGLGTRSPIPFAHASLKLYAQLRSLTQLDEPNDDLIDAWKETEQPIADGLINLLKHSQHFPDEFHQPLKMVNDVLARQIAKVSMKNLESTEELYPLLYVESQPVQQTAFDILHKQIPQAQEQISIDSALEKTTARLPHELLSLIIDAPTVAALAEANFERNVPLPLRGYLLSWVLVFDHLAHASFKVKNDYVDHIKEGEYLPGLLSFTFDFLGHAHNKPVDVSKLDVTTYEPDVEPPRRDLQWLLTHLYFLCLRHVPSLTKAWFVDCKSRATVVTLEPWTEKYVSPLSCIS
jgi:hypothetical protein